MSLNRRRFLKSTAAAAIGAPALMKSALAGGHGAIKFVSIFFLKTPQEPEPLLN